MTLLRYPGGKSRGEVHNQIISHIEDCYQGGWFAEPFFGGGGITLKLLKLGLIEKLMVAEKDSALLSMWKQIAEQPNRIINQIGSFKPSVKVFLEAKEKCLTGRGTGLDALVVNKTSHGGYGLTAGPQGGIKQTGAHKIGCRWNREALIKRVSAIHDLFSSVPIKWFSDYQECGKANYLYVDPPYWKVGQQMYKHGFGIEDHVALKQWLDGRQWLLSYDNHPEVRKLYQGYNILTTGTAGNGGAKPKTELLIWRFDNR